MMGMRYGGYVLRAFGILVTFISHGSTSVINRSAMMCY